MSFQILWGLSDSSPGAPSRGPRDPVFQSGTRELIAYVPPLKSVSASFTSAKPVLIRLCVAIQEEVLPVWAAGIHYYSIPDKALKGPCRQDRSQTQMRRMLTTLSTRNSVAGRGRSTVSGVARWVPAR